MLKRSIVGIPIMLLCFFVNAQTGNQSCEAGGEMWVCGKQEQLQAHDDFEKNCSDQEYQPCTVLRTIIDVCSPNMRETAVFQEGGPNCPLNNPQKT
ncbi:hypothetical protein [Roseivirga sp.]|uniref:hypothetical protein n=1 Tax=Roseivirga sp. TaxID=1964215 RepID=UPI003B8C563C